MPSRQHVRITRQAISPRFAIRSRLNGVTYRSVCALRPALPDRDYGRRARPCRRRSAARSRALVSRAASEVGARSIVTIPASPAHRSESEWLERGRALVLQRDLDGALAVFADAY